jgi:hypothetical protein
VCKCVCAFVCVGVCVRDLRGSASFLTIQVRLCACGYVMCVYVMWLCWFVCRCGCKVWVCLFVCLCVWGGNVCLFVCAGV